MILQRIHTHAGGMPGAQLLGLFDPLDPRIPVKPGDDLITPVSDHDDHFIATRFKTSPQHIFQHGPTADLMQRFRPGGFHPRAFAGGEDDGGARHKISAKCKVQSAK
jgi:hypothetical protein